MSKGNNGAVRPKLEQEGFFGRFSYFTRRALANLRQNVFVSAVTVGTIALALLIASLFLLVYVNLEGMAEGWSDKVQVTAYFDQEPAPLAVAAMKGRVQAIAGTSKVVFVSQAEAEKRLRSRLKGQESLLEGISTDVLPASLEIRLDRDHRDTESVTAYVRKLKQIQGISEVQYGEEWVKRFNSFMNLFRLMGALLGSFLTITVLFIVSNTIKLTIYARKDELELLGLVGATRFFIKAPFLIEGILQGAAGAVISLLALSGCYFAFLKNAGDFLGINPASAGLSFLPATHLAGVVLGGVLLGFIGSATSLKRFINV
ncbi:permease-like cell division protein FtsX [Geomonas subterranea]|uniref:Cell division protein FtsX n=1 Tax=Geomonas subterranea TaxID=2847989 RepID=A0ABX8LHB2_9BACT|nr:MULTISPECIES: permease-like cell division protein FtsX [Geomonas]QXE91123.1 permease-like cell division protein FtsX [Geomonas subterranea]QXM10790.1 permease-like cell division protein FtsX [Geomonas subterranea]